MLLAALCCLLVVAGEESLSWTSPEPETRQRLIAPDYLTDGREENR